MPPMEMNCIEEHLRDKIAENYNDRLMTIGLTEHITEHRGQQNLGQCQFRNLCMRGCPYGGYFSSNSSTLPAAERTGNMTLRPNSIVKEVIYDKDKKKAIGVTVLDAETYETQEFYAKVIFLNASALGSTHILLNSTSDRFPNGMGNDSGELGHNLMDHHFKAGAYGEMDDWDDMYYKGRRPNGIYIPRFRNINEKRDDFVRGYGYQGGGSRENWMDTIKEASIGAEFKEKIMHPGIWKMGLMGFGEMLPYHENFVKLDKNKVDKYGLPTFVIDCEFKENELNMRKDMMASAAEMLEKAGMKNINTYDNIGGPGLGIHEMGTARMGRDPKTSVLNKYNQVHAVKNVYVTDGACMTSSACQNPSLTYMALTARAANHASEQLKKGNF